MKKAIFNFIIMIYVIIAIIVTILLLSYNQYKVSEIAGRTFIIIDSDEISEDYQKGNLVIVKGKDFNDIEKGDKLFFYKDKEIQYGTVNDVHKYDGAGTTFIMDGNYQLVEDDAIGASKNTISIPNLGKILGVIESKWGFLFIIIFPSLIAFFREIMALILELREE